jgi:hypothetical protein
MNLTQAKQSLDAGADRPNLVALAYALRHPETWPEGFGPWDYTKYGTCAVCLVKELWFRGSYKRFDDRKMTEVFGISDQASESIFMSADIEAGIRWPDVQPDHVAAAIESYLASVAP